MFRSFGILLLKLQFLGFLAAGVVFSSIPYTLMGFFGLIAIPDAWKSKNAGIKTIATTGLVVLLAWSAYATLKAPVQMLSSVSSRGTKIATLGFGALLTVLTFSVFIAWVTTRGRDTGKKPNA